MIRLKDCLLAACLLRVLTPASVRCLKRVNLKAVLPGRFLCRMRRHPGPRIQTVTPVNNLSRSVSLRQQT